MPRLLLPLFISSFVIVALLGGQLLPLLSTAEIGTAPVAHAQAGLPPLPSGWPSTLPLGRADAPGGAAALKAQAPFGYRYQYLAGGANTGNGWATWNANGDFARYYIEDSAASGITPVFTYYQIYQSSPGGGGEQSAVIANLNNAATMRAYAADLKLFFQKAGAFPNTRVILHVEPDLWGYVQQVHGDDAASAPAQVAATGVAEWAGLPDTVAGLARGVVRLRDAHAPNVQVAYHVSVWGTGVDIGISDPSDAAVDALGNRAGAFYTSLGADFDLAFGEYTDRDSAFKVARYGMGQEAWWNAADFGRFARFVNRFVTTSGKRVVLWQIPFGNTRMRAMDNTWNHYQDNRVEWLLDEPARAHLAEYVDAGVIGFFFGRGAEGATCACDANGDDTTNPTAINGNNQSSYNADDDGGFFRNRAAAYYATGPMSLAGGSGQPATATPTATPGGATATPTATTPPVTQLPAPVSGGYSTGAMVAPASVNPGGSSTITALVRSGSAASVLVDVEIYSSTGAKVFQDYEQNQTFTAGQQRSFPFTWNVPAGTAIGSYTVVVAVFANDWTTNHAWNPNAGAVTVTSSSPATNTPTATATRTPTPTMTPTATATLPPITCSPRPPVQVSSAAGGGGLLVTVAATGANNRMLSLQFSETRNALVDAGGQAGRSGVFTVPLPGSGATTTFTLRRAASGAATVSLSVVDRCGAWDTFVGGGASAF